MKKLVLVAGTLLAGALLGSIITGSVFAAGPTPQTTPTPAVPGNGQYGRGMMGSGGMMGSAGMMGFGGGRMMGGEMGVGGMGFEDEVLALLNMTREQLIAERQAGKSLVQIAATKGVSEQTLVNSILAAKRADLNALVAQGKLTQAQADLMYANMQQTVPVAVNSTAVGPMHGNGVMDPENCPMLGDGTQPNTTQPNRGMMPGRGGMMNRGGARYTGPTT